MSKTSSAADGHLPHWGKSSLVHTLLVLPECPSVTSEVITLGVEACMFSHCFQSIVLCQGGWVPRGPSHGWAGAALGQEQWMRLTSHLLNSLWFFTKQRPSGCKFAFCLCLLTEEQSCPVRKKQGSLGSAKGAGQSGEGGAQIQPVSSPGQVACPYVDMRALSLLQRGKLSLCPKAMGF